MRKDSDVAKWTREQIIRAILRRESAGLPLALGGKEAVESALYSAASRVFGSWRNAVMAAGIPPERAKTKDEWPPSRILSTIRSLARRKRPLRVGELKRRYGSLVQAARRHFGSWSKAVVAAGVDPAKLRRVSPWTKERIIEAILTRALNNEPLGSRTVRPRSLAEAGARLFGSWESAMAAAGIDPKRYMHRQSGPGRDTVRRRAVRSVAKRRGQGRCWSDEDVLQGILTRLREHKRMNATAVRDEDSRLYWAAKGRYGSWRNAMLAAGLNPDEFQRYGERRGDGR